MYSLPNGARYELYTINWLLRKKANKMLRKYYKHAQKNPLNA